MDMYTKHALNDAVYDMTIGCGESDPDINDILARIETRFYYKSGQSLTQEEADFVRQAVRHHVQMIEQP